MREFICISTFLPCRFGSSAVKMELKEMSGRMEGAKKHLQLAAQTKSCKHVGGMGTHLPGAAATERLQKHRDGY